MTPSALNWIVWAILTLIWNAVNSVNSRAKNSRSLGYNLGSTAISAALYMTALLWVGNLLLRVHTLGDLELAVLIYGACSALGSIAGQKFALRFFASLESKQ